MMNFHARVADAAERFADRPAVQQFGPSGLETMTYAELMELAGSWAGWLRHCTGICRGDRVALLAANDGRWVAAYLGILQIGAVAVPLDTAYSIDQVRIVLADAQARAIVAGAPLLPVARAAAAAQPTPPVVARLDDGPPASAALRMTTDVAADDMAAILYTSGTTADPKGVVLTHANLEAERACALAVIEVDERDAVLGVLPLFHALAQMANLLLPLSAGARVVFLESVSSAALLDALETCGITVFACVPQFFYLLHQRVLAATATRSVFARAAFRLLIAANAGLRDVSGLNAGRLLFPGVHRVFGPHLRYLITGGSAFDPGIARDLYGLGLTVQNGYGLTETSGAATVARRTDRFTTSVGPPLPGVEIRIDGADASGRGEILIRGPIVMREYFERPDATAEALQDGWLRTGDLGFLDARGRLHITGRLKDVIVLSSGKNVHPEEIEAHYRQSSFIKELCVVGSARAGEPAAERLHAVIVPDADALRARGTVNVRELIRFEVESLSVQVPPHKRVLTFDIARDALPRTSTGKLKRAAIARDVAAAAGPTTRPAAREATGNDVRAWPGTPAEGRLAAEVARALGRQAVRPEDNLELDLGLDSMERVELFAAVESATGRVIPGDVRRDIFTAGDLVSALDAAAPAAATSGPGPSADATDDRTSSWHDLLAGPGDPEVTAMLARPSGLRAALLRAVLVVGLVLSTVVIRRRVTGREHLPARGPYLVCPNHQSFLDAFLVAGALPFRAFRQLFFVGAAEYFETSLTRRAARLANIVRVDPDAHLITAMRAAAAGLRLGKVLVLFPEGERSIDGRLKPFRKGAAILATETGAPIVPVAIAGAYDLWPRGLPIQWRRLRPWRRPVVTVAFGAPRPPQPGREQAHVDAVAEAVASLQAEAGVAPAGMPAARPD